MTEGAGRLLFDRELSESELGDFCQELATQILCGERFVVWLHGEMGSGKTCFVRYFLHGLGLDPETPVVSPTYTIVNEYQIAADWYAHLDLYRAEEGFSFEELGFNEMRSHRGIFMEWPQTSEPPEELSPDFTIAISYTDKGRRYEVYRGRGPL